MSIAELEAKISTLTDEEKNQLAERLFRHLAFGNTGIEKSASIVGGEARIAGTRIPVWVLEQYRCLGWSEARLLENYPSLRAADLVNAWAYVEIHSAEIDQAIRHNEEA